jgi:hypothetical protein
LKIPTLTTRIATVTKGSTDKRARKEVDVQRFTWFIAAVVIALSLGFGAGIKAASKSYQFTGTVKASDAGTLTVQKSATETWQFDTNKDTKGTAKVGDKVTVYYTMVATQIESKPAAAAPTKKPAAK